MNAIVRPCDLAPSARIDLAAASVPAEFKSSASNGKTAMLSPALYLPLYLTFGTLQHLAAVPATVVLYHMAVSGVFAGIFAVLTFTRSMELLGPSKAAVYPALVPAFGILLGLPITGEMPTLNQFAGLALVTLGLLIAIGVIRRPAAIHQI